VSDRLVRLYALRDQITGWLEQNAADRAPLALRLTQVLEQIEACEKAAPQTKGTALDEVNARRAAKVAKGSAGPTRRRV
jgi:hypothetical protein